MRRSFCTWSREKKVHHGENAYIRVKIYFFYAMYVCMYIFKFTSQPKAELRKLQ